MYLCLAVVIILLVLVVLDVYKKNNFCLYDKPIYYPKYDGLKARLYNPRCTAYCNSPDSECVVWCS
jgi:hypothetical protein